MRSFRHNQSGLIWVWVVWVIGIMFMSLVWFVFLYPVNQLVDTLEGTTGFPSEGQLTVDFLRTLYMVMPIIVAVGLTVWAYVYSQRHQEVTYPYAT